jgi:transposase
MIRPGHLRRLRQAASDRSADRSARRGLPAADDGSGRRTHCSVVVQSGCRRSATLSRDHVSSSLSPEFARLYAPGGRASIAPEKLLLALLLQAFYGVRPERQLMEQVTYNMLFRWFIGLSMDAPVWDLTVFTKNRERLLEGDIAVAFLLAIMDDPAVKRLLSDEPFSVDGTLIDAWASMKSFRRKDGSDDDPAAPGRNAERDFRGETRSNETHASVTDPDARL